MRSSPSPDPRADLRTPAFLSASGEKVQLPGALSGPRAGERRSGVACSPTPPRAGRVDTKVGRSIGFSCGRGKKTVLGMAIASRYVGAQR